MSSTNFTAQTLNEQNRVKSDNQRKARAAEKAKARAAEEEKERAAEKEKARAAKAAEAAEAAEVRTENGWGSQIMEYFNAPCSNPSTVETRILAVPSEKTIQDVTAEIDSDSDSDTSSASSPKSATGPPTKSTRVVHRKGSSRQADNGTALQVTGDGTQIYIDNKKIDAPGCPKKDQDQWKSLLRAVLPCLATCCWFANVSIINAAVLCVTTACAAKGVSEVFSFRTLLRPCSFHTLMTLLLALVAAAATLSHLPSMRNIDVTNTDVGNTDVGNTDVGNTDVGNTSVNTTLAGNHTVLPVTPLSSFHADVMGGDINTPPYDHIMESGTDANVTNTPVNTTFAGNPFHADVVGEGINTTTSTNNASQPITSPVTLPPDHIVKGGTNTSVNTTFAGNRTVLPAIWRARLLKLMHFFRPKGYPIRVAAYAVGSVINAPVGLMVGAGAVAEVAADPKGCYDMVENTISGITDMMA